MTTFAHSQPSRVRWPLAAWLPLAVLPAATAIVSNGLPAWVQMWALALCIYGCCKWLTFATLPTARRATLGQAAGYLFVWPGMDAAAFFGRAPVAAPHGSQSIWAAAQIAVGIWILIGIAPLVRGAHPLIAGWLSMAGVVSVLHFGVSQFLSLAWRITGTEARQIMDKPLLARSLSDFWGRRWNLAFRDLMHRFVLRPLAPALGSAAATLAVFLISGLIHDTVISFSARGGWGLPTLYFLIQGLGLLLEKSRLGQRIGLGHGVIGWLFAAIVVIGPLGLLFYPPFIMRVVLPMLDALTGGAS